MQLALPIIVLYNHALLRTSTYQTLEPQIVSCGQDNKIVVYDNSPTPQSCPLPAHVEYWHDPANSGLAAAYNYALKLAVERSIPWLLLLDQDSELAPDFYTRLESSIRRFGNRQEVAAIVPKVRTQKGLISPQWVRFGRLVTVHQNVVGPCSEEVSAINSGTAVKVEFMQRVQGFAIRYRLDFLDYWLFRTIHRQNRTVVIMPAVLQHELSVSDYQRVSVERYASIIAAESRFMLSEKSWPEVLVYGCRLLARAAKQLLLYKRPEIAFSTLRALGSFRRGRRQLLHSEANFNASGS